MEYLQFIYETSRWDYSMFTRKSVGRCRAILTARSIVLCNEYIEEANIPTVKFDHAQGAYIGAKHVLDRGYRNLIFAVVTKPKSLASGEKWAFTCNN